VVHESSTTTNFDIPFVNDGFLEFDSGNVQFRGTYSGRGGVAARNGAKTNLPITNTANAPERLLAFGNGSEILAHYNTATGELIFLKDLSALAGGLVKLIGPDGATIVAAGGGNIVAAGGGNIVAAGGLNLIGADGASILSHNGGALTVASIRIDANASMVANNGLIKTDGLAGLVANGTASILSHNGGTILVNNGGNLIGADGATIISRDGAGIIVNGGNVISTDGAGVISTDGAGITANGGSILSHNGGALGGNGTFTGTGFIQGGGMLRPGNSPGIMTWVGNLTVQSGGLLEIEIGGTTAGTQHDRVNVSGTFTMNGSLSVRFVNGYGNVQPSDFFDIATAGSPITTTLAGTRVNVFGSNGSLELQLVNGGKTLRLTNYQSSGPITFSSWANSYGLTGAAAAMTADPNNNGNPNLLDYALGLDPTVGGSTGIMSGVVEQNGQKFQTLSYTRPTGNATRTDITYTPERATSLVLANWSSSAADVVTYGVTPGPGSLETVTVRSTHPISSTNREFLRLSVTLNP
jgi:hypothetical protein